jgi:hypothetical protein
MTGCDSHSGPCPSAPPAPGKPASRAMHQPPRAGQPARDVHSGGREQCGFVEGVLLTDAAPHPPRAQQHSSTAGDPTPLQVGSAQQRVHPPKVSCKSLVGGSPPCCVSVGASTALHPVVSPPPARAPAGASIWERGSTHTSAHPVVLQCLLPTHPLERLSGTGGRKGRWAPLTPAPTQGLPCTLLRCPLLRPKPHRSVCKGRRPQAGGGPPHHWQAHPTQPAARSSPPGHSAINNCMDAGRRTRHKHMPVIAWQQVAGGGAPPPPCQQQQQQQQHREGGGTGCRDRDGHRQGRHHMP